MEHVEDVSEAAPCSSLEGKLVLLYIVSVVLDHRAQTLLEGPRAEASFTQQ